MERKTLDSIDAATSSLHKPLKKSQSSLSSFPVLATKAPLSQRQPSPPRAVTRLPGIDGKQRKGSRVYRYKILPGNNSRCVMAAMKRRPWWHALLSADDEETLAATQPTFLWEMYRNSARYKNGQFRQTLLNRIQRNSCLVTKKGIYLSIKAYCERTNADMLSIIPRTFYLAPGSGGKSMKDDDLASFEEYNQTLSTEGKSPEEAIWILKPASKTNRGFGIKVVKGLSAVMKTVQRVSSASSTHSDESSMPEDEPAESIPDKDNPLFKVARKIARQDGYIVQQYMERPLLVDGRKFDIRCFVLVTVFDSKRRQGNGIDTTSQKEVKAYFFSDAYVRTSCKKYNLDKLGDRATHLTNDAVQKHVNGYGQFEQGNKLSLSEWQTFIDTEYPHAPKNVVFDRVFPEIKRLSRLSVEACAEPFSQTEINRSFELFGYDYMITEDFQPVLIEVNTNPCLEFVCPLLTDIISRVVDDSFKLTLDVLYPPPGKASRTKASEEAWQALQSEKNSFEPLYP
eukprot:gene1365-1486_t